MTTDTILSGQSIFFIYQTKRSILHHQANFNFAHFNCRLKIYPLKRCVHQFKR